MVLFNDINDLPSRKERDTISVVNNQFIPRVFNNAYEPTYFHILRDLHS